MAADRDRPTALPGRADSGQPVTGQAVTGQIDGGRPFPELPPPVAMAGVMQPRGPDGVELRCLVCDRLFTAQRRDRRTCSRRCARIDVARRYDPESVRRCAHCGKRLVGGRSDRRYCNGRCRVRAFRQRHDTRSTNQ